MINIKNTAGMSGSKMNAFWLLAALSGFAGVGIGKFLFMNNMLAMATGIVMFPVSYIVFKVGSRWFKRNQDELLENSMNLITNSYLGCNDIIAAVNDNLNKLDVYKPFGEWR